MKNLIAIAFTSLTLFSVSSTESRPSYQLNPIPEKQKDEEYRVAILPRRDEEVIVEEARELPDKRKYIYRTSKKSDPYRTRRYQRVNP